MTRARPNNERCIWYVPKPKTIETHDELTGQTWTIDDKEYELYKDEYEAGGYRIIIPANFLSRPD